LPEELRGDEELFVRVEGLARANEPFITVEVGHVVRREQAWAALGLDCGPMSGVR